MNPKYWGKKYWGFLFATALGYPRNPDIDTQHNYSRFFFDIKYVLPCESCKYNYENHYRKLPINFYLQNRVALLNWVLMLHNEVNRTLNKPPISAIQAISKYLNINMNNHPEVYADCIKIDNRHNPVREELVQITGDVKYQYSDDQVGYGGYDASNQIGGTKVDYYGGAKEDYFGGTKVDYFGGAKVDYYFLTLLFLSILAVAYFAYRNL